LANSNKNSIKREEKWVFSVEKNIYFRTGWKKDLLGLEFARNCIFYDAGLGLGLRCYIITLALKTSTCHALRPLANYVIWRKSRLESQLRKMGKNVTQTNRENFIKWLGKKSRNGWGVGYLATAAENVIIYTVGCGMSQKPMDHRGP